MQLYARLKGEELQYRTVITAKNNPDFEYLPVPDVSIATEFAPLDTELEKGSWQYVELEQEQIEEMIEIYTDHMNSSLQPLTMPEYDAVDTLIGMSSGHVLFRKVAMGMKIHENGKQMITFGEDGVQATRVSFGLEFDGEADAMYEKSSKRLYFTSFSKVRSLFKGIDVFYQDVTLEEKEAFLNNDMFAVGNVDLYGVSLNDTLRLAAIREADEFDFSDEDTQARIRSYAGNYPSSSVGINDEGKIIINSKKDLRSAIALLEQKFFTAEITGEKFIAGTAKRMGR